jgi:hypothetical protein
MSSHLDRTNEFEPITHYPSLSNMAPWVNDRNLVFCQVVDEIGLLCRPKFCMLFYHMVSDWLRRQYQGRLIIRVPECYRIPVS